MSVEIFFSKEASLTATSFDVVELEALAEENEETKLKTSENEGLALFHPTTFRPPKSLGLGEEEEKEEEESGGGGEEGRGEGTGGEIGRRCEEKERNERRKNIFHLSPFASIVILFQVFRYRFGLFGRQQNRAKN